MGLRLCARAFSSYGKRGPLFIAVRGPLTIAASLVAEHRLQTRRLRNCGSPAQSLRGMWDPPRPGLEPVPPAPAGRLSTTAPPGKPQALLLINKDMLLKFPPSPPATAHRKTKPQKIYFIFQLSGFCHGKLLLSRLFWKKNFQI